eukprot:gene556-700_t
MAASQDRIIRFFDTNSWNVIKTVTDGDVNWAVIDTDYSPDQNWLIYSSWSPYIRLVRVKTDNDTIDERDIHDRLNLDPDQSRFCVFGLKFSPNSSEILCGSTNGYIYLYDLITRQRTEEITGHFEDVNSVTYLDKTGNLFATGSDDYYIKVWDKRVLTVKMKANPIGVLVGHGYGITHVTSKDDGIYLLSNSKDQTAKLWDIRKMSNPSSVKTKTPPRTFWDNYYFSDSIPPPPIYSQENDNSLMTYIGHSVAKTLIRCYFSPVLTTGQKYIYSGSSTGEIFIYDVLTGRIVRKLNQGKGVVVRDLCWSPISPEIISTSWGGYITKWDSWSDSRDENQV